MQSTSRDRFFRAIEGACADRIPIDFWASKSMIAKIVQESGVSYEAFLDDQDIDFRYIEGPKYVGPPSGRDKDIWGVPRTVIEVPVRGGVESYSEVADSPLSEAESIEDVERYPLWPSPDWFDYSTIEAQCDEVRSAGRVAVFMGDRMNRVAQLKPAMYIRGMEEIFVDMSMNEDVARAVFGRIHGFYMTYLERILEAARGKIDIVLTGDDFGGQNGPLVSPELWRRFLKPGFAEYLKLIRKHGAVSMHHTCGSVVDLIPDFIECGLDVLQSIQPEAAGMSLERLKSEFGEQLSFHGGISIQQTMPFGNPEDIRREVKKIAEMVNPSGRYIFCTAHNIQADTSYENVLALLDAYREYGAC